MSPPSTRRVEVQIWRQAGGRAGGRVTAGAGQGRRATAQVRQGCQRTSPLRSACLTHSRTQPRTAALLLPPPSGSAPRAGWAGRRQREQRRLGSVGGGTEDLEAQLIAGQLFYSKHDGAAGPGRGGGGEGRRARHGEARQPQQAQAWQLPNAAAKHAAGPSSTAAARGRVAALQRPGRRGLAGSAARLPQALTRPWGCGRRSARQTASGWRRRRYLRPRCSSRASQSCLQGGAGGTPRP